tara:strand:- start:308 stop:631 length:324 start_codon:yes stop_codon:yes gene_type:complete
MDDRIEGITKILDSIVEPFLSTDNGGEFKETRGYLRRGEDTWPCGSGDCRQWSLAYEVAPEFESTGMIDFLFSERKGYTVNGKNFGDDFIEAFKEFRDGVSKIPYRS